MSSQSASVIVPIVKLEFIFNPKHVRLSGREENKDIYLYKQDGSENINAPAADTSAMLCRFSIGNCYIT